MRYQLSLLLALAGLLLAACTATPTTEAPAPGDDSPSVTNPAPTDTSAPSPDEPVTNATETPTEVPDATEEPPADEGEVIPGTVYIDGVSILILESYPVQVHVTVSGSLADGCTTISDISQARQDNTFTVTIAAERPADALCTQALVPFEEVVALDVVGLPAGTYTVDVNGFTDTFELQIDN